MEVERMIVYLQHGGRKSMKASNFATDLTLIRYIISWTMVDVVVFAPLTDVWMIIYLQHSGCNCCFFPLREIERTIVYLRWVINVSSRSPKLEWASFTHRTPYITKRIRKVPKKTNYTLNTLSTEYTQQTFMHTSRIFHCMCSMQVSKSV